jgi:RimJ/RimL family protein N-acetyltransferase
MTFWAERGYGIWIVRTPESREFLGITGMMDRADGLGVALRFAFRPEMRGRGLASEAAGAALRFGHDRAGLRRIIAVARESNFASRTLLGAIGMVECDQFIRQGECMLIYESVRRNFLR